MTGVAFNFLLTGSLVVLIYLFNRGALGLFLPADGAAIEIARHINTIAVWSFVFFGVSFVLGGVVRSTGAVVPPLIILVIALWIIRIPFAYGFVGRLGSDSIWWSFPLGSLVSMLLSIAYYRFGNWRSARMLPAGARAASRPAVAAAAAAEAPAAAAATDP
jgi:Na+-driven multidrug efflux pump